MYILYFHKNSSNRFPEALNFALELGGIYENGIVTVRLTNLLSAYAEIRVIFGIIQNWKGTTATYNGKPVHPYQFLLQAHWIGDCYEDRLLDNNCGEGWNCLKIDNLRYHIKGDYYPTHNYWYNYGGYTGNKWIIDKSKIIAVLLKYISEKGIDLCPFFDETKLKQTVLNLPTFLVPDNKTFEITYTESYFQGEKILSKHNIKHVTKTKIMKLI